jgi:hypothetical protein
MPYRFANAVFVSVHSGSINEPVAGFKRMRDGVDYFIAVVCLEDAQPKLWNRYVVVQAKLWDASGITHCIFRLLT